LRVRPKLGTLPFTIFRHIPGKEGRCIAVGCAGHGDSGGAGSPWRGPSPLRPGWAVAGAAENRHQLQENVFVVTCESVLHQQPGGSFRAQAIRNTGRDVFEGSRNILASCWIEIAGAQGHGGVGKT